MHPATIFHQHDADALSALVDARGLALIVAVLGGRPLIAHAPVLLGPQGVLRFHLSSASRLVDAIAASGRALAVVTGADAYVSPDWYASANQVPTWNYVSAEVEGAVRTLSRHETIELLDDLSAHFETQLAPKKQWSRDKLDRDLFQRMLAAIVGYELAIDRCEGVAKLSQNKTAAEIESVAEHLAGRRDDASAQAVSRMMRLNL